MRPSPLLISALLSLTIHTGSTLYVYRGDPFQSGPLEVATVTLNDLTDGIPKRTEVFYPTAPGTYTPIFFVPGLFGAVYTELYADVLANTAGYGFIIAGVDVQWPALTETPHKQQGDPYSFTKWALNGGMENVAVKAEPEDLFKVLQWLENNLNQRVLPSQGAGDVEADWTQLGIMSHSASSEFIIKMLLANSTFAKAVAFLEPGSTNFKEPLGFPIPALSYGTQFCTETPKCCLPGFSYVHYYSLLTCPKILMNVTGFGHCDIIEDYGWDLCHAVHFCKTEAGTNRNLYREEFVPGVLTSMFGTFLQGNPDLLTYITHRDDMPIALGQLEFDLNCTLS